MQAEFDRETRVTALDNVFWSEPNLLDGSDAERMVAKRRGAARTGCSFSKPRRGRTLPVNGGGALTATASACTMPLV